MSAKLAAVKAPPGSLGPRSVRQSAPGGESLGDEGKASASQSPVVLVAPELLSDEQAGALLGISVRKFHEMRSMLPAPVVLGPRCVRWIRAELVSALPSLPRQTTPQEPTQLLRGRIERMKRDGAQQQGGSNASNTSPGA